MNLPRKLLNSGVLSMLLVHGAQALGETAEVSVGFQDVLSQIFAPTCVSCHGPRRSFKGVRLDSLEAAQAFIAPGNAAASLLVQVIESGAMPPNGQKVSPENLELLKNWIDGGAKN